MKKLITICLLLATGLTTKAQELDGVWKLEKMRIFGNSIYFDDSNKDKDNYINALLKNIEMGLDTEEEKVEWKKSYNNNKASIYASGKKLYKNNIEFKEGNLIYKFQNHDLEMEKVEMELDLIGDILKFYGGENLNNISSFKISAQPNKLILTEISRSAESEEELMVFIYEKV